MTQIATAGAASLHSEEANRLARPIIVAQLRKEIEHLLRG